MRGFSATAILVVLAAAFSVTGSAWAAPPPASGKAVAAQVRDAVARNPGARQISANAVELKPGVVMSIVPKTAVTPLSASGCLQKHLCLFRAANFYPTDAYWYLVFYDCGLENLGDWSMRDGTRWNDQVSSIDNPQSGGVVSRFYNYNGRGDPMNLANDTELLSLPSGHYLKNLAWDKSEDGSGSPNDWIDVVKVC
jgi:hypothetical protein